MKKPVEPIILTVALLVLALGAALLAYLYPTEKDITGIGPLTAVGKNVTPLKAEAIDDSLAIWASPTLWTEPSSHSRLFHSDEYLFYPSAYPNGDYIKKIGPDTRSPSGVLLSWYKKYGLDYTDPLVDREDPDGDGFSTLTEFKNEPVGAHYKAADLDGTKSANPIDSKSHPDYLSRLRLEKYELRPFHIFFNGYQPLNGVILFQLHLNDVPSYNQPQLKKTGDELGFEGYIVGAFHQEFKDIMDDRTGAVVHTDVSTLELDKPDIGLKVPVPFRKEINSPESTADFVMLMPTEREKEIRVSRGKTFSIPFLPEVTFKVIDAGDNGATIKDMKTGQSYTIPKLDPAEWDEVPELPASKQP
jgi:hypothetical protein